MFLRERMSPWWMGNMAARTKKIRHDDETRAKIQAALLINRLQDHVMGEVELDSAQVSSAKTLLNKVLPDLRATEVSGPDGQAIPTSLKVTFE